MNRSVRGRLRWLVPLLLLGVVVLLGANFWRLNQPPPPDPRLIAMAVRATVFALPTATPFVREIEVTRVVEITRLVQAPTPIPTVTATLTPTVAPTATPAPAALAPDATGSGCAGGRRHLPRRR